jgi:hypothetical protein
MSPSHTVGLEPWNELARILKAEQQSPSHTVGLEQDTKAMSWRISKKFIKLVSIPHGGLRTLAVRSWLKKETRC